MHHRAKYRTLAASSTSPKYSKTPFTTFARDGIRTCRPRPFAPASIAKMQQNTLTSFDRDGNRTYLLCCLSHRFSLVEPNFDIARTFSKSCRVDRYYSRSDSTRVNYFVNFPDSSLRKFEPVNFQANFHTVKFPNSCDYLLLIIFDLLTLEHPL